ncbi:MAG: sulfate reduction electron transfer complex DsrMKJOP subunit DsrM [Bryobacteraceae bacterium]
MTFFFGVVLPYVAIAVFLAGIVWRVARWARSPVPFRIPTVCGQHKSLDFIKPGRLESPATGLGVAGRMALEILLFRSLFRNTRSELMQGPRLVQDENKILWLGALMFHYSFLVIFVRHLRFFLEPAPWCVATLEAADGFFQVGAPPVYATDVGIAAALGYLFLRRVWNPQVRYISLFSDYFALLLLGSIAVTGILMRYFMKVNLMEVKRLAIGLVTFTPYVPENVSWIFYAHVALVSALFVYFPFSKLVHMGGVFLSPTRNLANNNRRKRHVNPWNYPVKVHTYEEWEHEFHDKMKAAGLPLEAQQ